MREATLPSRDEVISAGDYLRGHIAEPSDAAVDAFRTAYAWREAHLVPLHSVRMSLRQIAGAVDTEPLVAGRIKRMSSIRKKLRSSRINLWDIQDVAGVRAVLPNIDLVNEVAARIEGGRSIHRLAKHQDYILAPKASGYRGRHLMMRYQGENEILRNRSVEIQIRTLNQHAWATALEAVGLMRGEDLKGGKGDASWLRFFALMACEFAHVEDQPLVPGVPESSDERRRELLELEGQIKAVDTLTGYRRAIRGVSESRGARGSRFIITFDRNRQRVSVRAVTRPEAAIARLREAEASGSESVLVEVDSVDALESAYPNYFMDVAHFTEQLRRSLVGGPKGRSVRQLLDSWRFWKGYDR